LEVPEHRHKEKLLENELSLRNVKLFSGEQDVVSKLYPFRFLNTLHILFDAGILLRFFSNRP
jgi:hypothetical protein